MNRALLLLVVFVLVSISTVSAQCVNISDVSTWGTKIVNASNLLYVNENTTLCTDTYYLNLSSNTTAALTINASGIYLDCNQSILDGVIKTGYGIYMTGKENNSIGNCTVRNYNRGFLLDSNSNYNTLTSNTAYNSSRQGFRVATSSKYNMLNSNTAYGNLQSGFYIYSSSNNNLTNNTAYNNTQYGFALDASSNNTLTGNVAYNSSLDGFLVYDSSNNNILTNNTAYNNTQQGFDIYTSSNNTLTSNTAYSNTLYGVYIYTSSNNNNLTGNTAYNNRQGILLNTTSKWNTLTDNTAYNNTAYGFYLISSNWNNLTGNYGYNNSASGFYLSTVNYSVLTGNFGFNNTQHGFLTYPAYNNTFINNTGYGNKLHGFYFFTFQYNAFTGNTAYNNTAWGFYLSSASNNTFVDTVMYGNIKGSMFLNSLNNNFTNTFIYNQTIYLNQTSAAAQPNNFTNLTLGYNSTIGLVNYQFLNISSTLYLNYTNLKLDPYFVSLDDTAVPQANLSANITILTADCSYSIFRKAGFPLTAGDITANGTLFSPLSRSCGSNILTFGVGGFSGYSAGSECINISDPTTWRTIVNSSGVLYVNANTTLCTGTYAINAATSGAALQINSSNIFLDCNGSTIDGTDTAGSYGVLVGNENAIIKNCLISDWAIGVKLSSANYSTVTNSTIWSNANNSVFVLSSTGVNVTDSIFENNTREGLLAQAVTGLFVNGVSSRFNTREGMYVTGLSSHILINGSTTFKNVRYGVLIDSGTSGATSIVDANFTNNAAANNSRGGIAMQYVVNYLVANSVLQNNSWYGIALYNSTYGNISGNDVRNNTLDGIAVSLEHSDIVENNTISGNIKSGVSMSGYPQDANVTVRSNIIELNGNNGVSFSGFSGGGLAGFAIKSNIIRNNSWDGIRVNQAGNNNSIENNLIYNNTYNGIHISNSSSSINVTGNNISFNRMSGILLNVSNYSVISNNNISQNAYHGTYALSSYYNSVQGNTISGHNVTGYSSIYIHYSNYNNFTANTADLGYYGIFCDYCNSTNVINNTVLRHIREGLRFDSGLETVMTIFNPNLTGNYIDNSGYSTDNCVQFGTSVDGIVAHNQVYNCLDGFHIRGNSHNNTIINNTGANFASNAIDLQGVWNNTVMDNSFTNYSTSPLLVIPWYPNVNDTYCDNIVVNNTGDLGLPVFYSNETGTYSGGTYAYFGICGAPNSIIENMTFTGLSPDRRNSYLEIIFSDNTITRNIALTDSHGVGIASSNNCTVANVSMENTEWGILFFLGENSSLAENVSISDALHGGIYIYASANNTFRNFMMGGGNASYSAIFLYNGSTNSTDNTLDNVTVYSVPRFVMTWPISVGPDNILTGFRACKDDPSANPAGCIEFDYLNISTANLTNNTNILLANDFVSINSSDPGAAQFNSSANVTLQATCSPTIMYSVFKKEGFPSSSADILANGSLYGPTHMDCTGNYLTFGVTSFSGYALQEGTLNLSILPNTTVTYKTETNVSCSANNSEVFLRLYRNDTEVANGTSYIEYLANLSAGTYNFTCNVSATGNYTTAETSNILTINRNTSSCSLSFDPSSPRTYGTPINASCSCTNPETPATLWRNNTNVTAENNQFVLIPGGTWNYVCNVTQTENYTNATTNASYTVNTNATVLSLSFFPSDVVLSHQQTNVSCSVGNSEIMLKLYRNDVLVANGTSHIEDVQSLAAGTHEYVCNTTGDENYTNASVSGLLVVRGLSTSRGLGAMGISIAGDKTVGSTLTFTVLDGSTPVRGADVRISYWSNRILNAIGLGLTNSTGQVSFTSTVAGEYKVEATKSGYEPGERAFTITTEAGASPPGEQPSANESIGQPQEEGQTPAEQPPGTEAPSGATTPECTINADCASGFECQNSSCIAIQSSEQPSAPGGEAPAGGTPSAQAQMQGIPWWVWLLIVIILGAGAYWYLRMRK